MGTLKRKLFYKVSLFSNSLIPDRNDRISSRPRRRRAIWNPSMIVFTDAKTNVPVLTCFPKTRSGWFPFSLKTYPSIGPWQRYETDTFRCESGALDRPTKSTRNVAEVIEIAETT
ncbi:hypothetical protein EVAR_97260_1 [Eumeta japonica]|uniref:Uncharacterized protein n=1 Tax=Eumeta variegata TaxID=151549 RepID=A0A4C1XEF9_EUMVA|nr:hypothetical protein EVAR_97260_1 [Eumeta japonica]